MLFSARESAVEELTRRVAEAGDGTSVTRIGTITTGNAIRYLDDAGHALPDRPEGWDHFRQP